MTRTPRRRSRSRVATALAVACACVLAACGVSEQDHPSAASPGTQPSPGTATPTTASTGAPSSSPRTPSSPPRRARPSDLPAVGATPPSWLGTRVLPRQPDGFGRVGPTPRELQRRRFTLPDRLPALPGDGFASRVTTPAPAVVIARSTWRKGCPVAADQLSWVRVTFVGFDGRRHTGELLVNGSVAGDVVKVFRRLYAARFPLEEMRITRADELDAPPTGDGNNTGAFACRPVRGATTYSQHAYGLAIDVNPFQNPYSKGDLVLPELASSYLQRGRVRPGMIEPGDPVVRAFSGIGWGWGGTWNSLKDYQHFSQNGR